MSQQVKKAQIVVELTPEQWALIQRKTKWIALAQEMLPEELEERVAPCRKAGGDQ